MKTACIIAEFNPYHNGHKYIADKAREFTGADYVIALMSGDFVQRGAPAIIDRSKRARMALSCGIDLVAALPTRYATSSAEEYAMHAVRMIDEMGCVDTLFFGSECGEIDRLTEVSRILVSEPEDYRERLLMYLKQGFSFPRARALALPDYSDILSTPNNILGIEYTKAIIRRRSSIIPATCARIGAEHISTALSGTYTSATALRQHLIKPEADISQVENSIPAEAFRVLTDDHENGRMLSENDLSFLLASSLWQASSADKLTKYLSVTPQLANAIFSARELCTSFMDYAMHLKNRSLTLTHITRALLHIALRIEKDKPVSDMAHILGFRKNAGPLISHIKETSSIPIVARPARDLSGLNEGARALFDEEVQLSNLYNVLVSQKTGEPVQSELSRRLITV